MGWIKCNCLATVCSCTALCFLVHVWAGSPPAGWMLNNGLFQWLGIFAFLTGHWSGHEPGGAGGQPGDHRPLWFKGECCLLLMFYLLVAFLCLVTEFKPVNLIVSSTHFRRSWMLFRTRRRPAAPSLVSLGLASTRPSWCLTAWMCTPALLSLVPRDTSGPQTGESKYPGHNPALQLWNECSNVTFFVVVVSHSSGVFEIAEASGVQQGTKIVLHLKDDCKEFSSEDRVKGKAALKLIQKLNCNCSEHIYHHHHSTWWRTVVFLSEVITKYSNFVSFPIFLNGRRLNTLQVSCSAF